MTELSLDGAGTRSFNGVPKPVYRAMQLIKRLGNVALPVALQGCAGPGFNCTCAHTHTHTHTHTQHGLYSRR